MQGHGEKLSRKQESAIIALLYEPTIKEAAVKAGVSESTLSRWLQNESFNRAFKDAKRLAVSQAITRLQQVSSEAVNTLFEVMRDVSAPPSSRVSASKIILETAFKALELEDLASRVDELEQVLDKVW